MTPMRGSVQFHGRSLRNIASVHALLRRGALGILGAVSIVLCASTASAQYAGLKDSVVAEFTKEDYGLFSKALHDALRGEGAASSQEWSNPATEAHGTVHAGEMVDHEQWRCRKAKLESFANKKHGTSTFTFCEMEGGEWKVLR